MAGIDEVLGVSDSEEDEANDSFYQINRPAENNLQTDQNIETELQDDPIANNELNDSFGQIDPFAGNDSYAETIAENEVRPAVDANNVRETLDAASQTDFPSPLTVASETQTDDIKCKLEEPLELAIKSIKKLQEHLGDVDVAESDNEVDDAASERDDAEDRYSDIEGDNLQFDSQFAPGYGFYTNVIHINYLLLFFQVNLWFCFLFHRAMQTVFIWEVKWKYSLPIWKRWKIGTVRTRCPVNMVMEGS